MIDSQTLLQVKAALKELMPDYKGTQPTPVEKHAYDMSLCQVGKVSEADLCKCYSDICGLTEATQDSLTVYEPFEDIDSQFLFAHGCIPIKWENNEVTIMIATPYLTTKLGYLFDKTYQHKASFCFGRRSTIDRLIQSIYEGHSRDESDVDALDSGEQSLVDLASEVQVVRQVNEIFTRALEQGASDIHIEPETEKLVIRFRIDGVLVESMTMPSRMYPAISSRIKLVGGLNIAETRLPQDGRTNIKLGAYDFDIRINTIPIMNGESLVLRLLKKDSGSLNVDSIGLSDGLKEQLGRLIQAPHGMILVVGPTGSGKTTTLYSLINQINSEKKKIITIEDPVEYEIGRLSQMQVNPSIGLTFADGLRNIVRQDPDVILVGEIRDAETAEIAINAALTGHLVFSTLHTNDAAGTISRLQDMGIENFLISSALTGVLSQRLVRKVCPACSGQGSYSFGSKCDQCGGVGYKGRTGIYELMVVSDSIRDLINTQADSSAINECALREGMTSLIDDGAEKVTTGITTDVEVQRVTNVHVE